MRGGREGHCGRGGERVVLMEVVEPLFDSEAA